VVDPEELTAAARAARENAYAPYSDYRVGAALVDDQGRIFTGCNVENVSYPASICAERVAIGSMVAANGRRLVAIAVATDDGGTPCGVCLQTISEFASPEGAIIYVVDKAHRRREFSLGELFPHGFSSKEVKRTNDSTR
jgi:cytidine deaminase